MKIDVLTRVNRILKPMDRFRFIGNNVNEDNIGSLKKGEILIGAYKNNNNDVFITNRGLLIRSQECDRNILFRDIVDVRPPADKQNDYTITLLLASGVEFPLEIRGGGKENSKMFLNLHVSWIE